MGPCFLPFRLRPRSSSKGKMVTEQLRILHDPGHGGSNSGCQHGELIEKEWVLRFAQDMHNALSHWRIKQNFTRDFDRDMNFSARGNVAYNWRADLALVYHVNAYKKDNMHGLLCFVLPDRWVEAEVGAAIMRAAPKELRGVVKKPVQSVPKQWTNEAYNTLKEYKDICPAVLVEVGFASNPKDYEILMGNASRPALVVSVLAGIARLLEIKGLGT